MIDHLLRFDDEATARAALPTYAVGDTDWSSEVIPAVRVVLADGQYDAEVVLADGQYDAEVHVVTPPVYAEGWYVLIATLALDETLRDLPGYACRLITDREAANAGRDFILYVAPDVDPHSLAVGRVEPVFAGSGYPMGGAQL